MRQRQFHRVEAKLVSFTKIFKVEKRIENRLGILHFSNNFTVNNHVITLTCFLGYGKMFVNFI